MMEETPIARPLSEVENVRELVAGDYVVRYLLRLEEVIQVLRGMARSFLISSNRLATFQ
ncbi:MAG: hypothetical protein V7L00_03390 [Nostoc sp.]|uniref:hypothetical protein n=1 Tax=Nostoc sp. TaxID=1180 RepID=UPI002FFB3F7D